MTRDPRPRRRSSSSPTEMSGRRRRTSRRAPRGGGESSSAVAAGRRLDACRQRHHSRASGRAAERLGGGGRMPLKRSVGTPTSALRRRQWSSRTANAIGRSFADQRHQQEDGERERSQLRRAVADREAEPLIRPRRIAELQAESGRDASTTRCSVGRARRRAAADRRDELLDHPDGASACPRQAVQRPRR